MKFKKLFQPSSAVIVPFEEWTKAKLAWNEDNPEPAQNIAAAYEVDYDVVQAAMVRDTRHRI